MRVLRQDRLGGLIREYVQVAWGDTGPSEATGHAKVAVRLGCDMPLDTGLALEREAIAHVFASDDATEGDATEGIVAFGDKRTPAFHGR